VLKNFSFVSEH